MIIYANLDQEARWSGLGIPVHVARRISAAASLLAALAPEPVEIFAPADVDPAQILFAKPAMRVGQPPRWDLAWADPAAKHVNDRRFALAVARELGCALPGARAVESVAELPDALATATGRWVAKAAWSAAGRDRAFFTHGTRDAEARAHVVRMLARAGAVVIEPWLERSFDFAVCGAVDRAGRITAHPPHTLRTDARGTFTAIERTEPPLDRAEVDRVVAGVGAALARAGYAGPFGIDGFVHAGGMHPLCEINARYTFGHVAHALGARVLGFGPPPPNARLLVAPPFTAWAVE